MKIIILSDLHLHPWNYGSTIVNGFNSRLYAQYETLNKMLEIAEENNVKHIFFLGDLFHQHGNIPTQALYLFTNFLNNLKFKDIKFHSIVGNHDLYDKAGTIHSLNWLQKYGNVCNSLTARHFYLEDQEFFALGYTEDKDKLIRFLKEKVESESIVLLHQGISGCSIGSGYVINEILSKELINPETKHCFAGHYHNFNRVKNNLTIPGCLTPLTWSDVNSDKGFIIFDTENKNSIYKYELNIAPRFIEWNTTEWDTEDEIKSDTPNVLNSFVRIKCQQGQFEDLKKLVLENGALKVEYISINKLEENSIEENTKIKTFNIMDQLFQIEEKIKDKRRKEIGVELREEKYEIT